MLADKLVPVCFGPFRDPVDGVRIHGVFTAKRGFKKASVLKSRKACRVLSLLDPAICAVVAGGDFNGVTGDFGRFHSVFFVLVVADGLVR